MPKPFALEIVGPEDPLFAEAEAAEARIFLRAFNNSPEIMEQEYGRYKAASTFVVVRDEKNHAIAGEMRLINESPAGFKSLNDLAGEPWHLNPPEALRATGLQLTPETTIDVATLGIEAGYRRQDDNPEAEGLIGLALFHGVCRYMQKNGKKDLVAILDDKVLSMFDMLGSPMRPYKDARTGQEVPSMPYLDSPSSKPVWMNLSSAEKRLRLLNPDLHNLIINGIGLDEVVELAESKPPLPPEDLAA